MAAIYPFQNKWRAQICVGGVRESAVFDEKCQAELWSLERTHHLKLLKGALRRYKSAASVAKVLLETDASHSEDSILRHSTSIPAQCGVYFLIQGTSIVYVGQSKNVHARVAQHRADKTFDRVTVIECQPKDLLGIEAAYIKKFNPMLNKVGADRFREVDLAIAGLEECQAQVHAHAHAIA